MDKHEAISISINPDTVKLITYGISNNKRPACSEPCCGMEFRTIKCLRQHLINVHSQRHPEINYTFQTHDEFTRWKSRYEDENLVNFSQHARHVKGDVISTHFYCNRCYKSGRNTKQPTGKMKSKSIGSVVMHVACTCGLILLSKDNEFNVKLYPSHYNHSLDENHKKFLRLTEAEKDDIIRKMENGISNAEIIQGKPNVNYDTLRRLKTLNQKHMSGRKQTNKLLEQDRGILADNKSYQCKQCEMFFKTNYHLKLHACIHPVEKPYECTQCEKCFECERTFKLHMQIHTSEEPYQHDMTKNHNENYEEENCEQTNKCLNDLGDKLEINNYFHNEDDSETLENPTYFLSSVDSELKTKNIYPHPYIQNPIVEKVCHPHTKNATGEKIDQCSKAASLKNKIVEHMEIHTMDCNEGTESENVVNTLDGNNIIANKREYGRFKKPACSESDCGMEFRTIASLRLHLIQVHNQSHPEHLFTFQTQEEFLSWKSKYEANNLVNFSVRKKYIKYDSITTTFRCHRCYKPVTTKEHTVKRRVKAIGSVYMDVVCTCSLFVTSKQSEVSVKLYPSHYNHNLDKDHEKFLKLTECEKEDIIKKIDSGVSKAEIVQGIRKNDTNLHKEDGKVKHHKFNYDTIYNLSRRKAIEGRQKNKKVNQRECAPNEKKKKLHQCKYCDKTFTMKIHLRRHSSIHSEVKQFKCDQCEKSFTYTVNLKRHMQIHTGKKPHMNSRNWETTYQCSYCNFSASKSSILKNHMKVHMEDKNYNTGEKSYQCFYGTYIFSDDTRPESNMKINSLKAPYKCNQCDKEFPHFTSFSVITNHIKNHKKEKEYGYMDIDEES